MSDIREKFTPKTIRKTPTEQLVRKLNDLWGLTARKLKLSACILQELERRGYNVGLLNRGGAMMRWLRLVAAESLLPEVVEAFYHHSQDLVDAIARLPIADQRALLETGKVAVLIGDKMEELPLSKLERQSIMIAFGTDHIRTEAEQRQLFAPKPIADRPAPAPAPKEEPKREPHFRVNPVPEKKGYRVGQMFVPAEEIVRAQAEATAGAPIPEPDPDVSATETMTFYCEPWEKQAIRAMMRKTGKSESLLVREALWAQYGVFLNTFRPK